MPRPKTVTEYHGKGYIYDNGEIPTCDFCGVGADEEIIRHRGICEILENLRREKKCQHFDN